MKRVSVLIAMLLIVFSIFIQSTDAQTLKFKDVSKSNAHYDGIHYLTNSGVINGYNDNTFRPNQTITRSQTALLFTKALELPTPSNTSKILKNYKDVNVNHQYANEIAATYEAGIFKGSKGYFNDGALNREQMATVIVNAFDLKDNGQKIDANLSNISPSHKENVKILFQHGITNQTKDYRPSESVTRGQFATFLYKVMTHEEEVIEEEPKEDKPEEEPKEDISDEVVVYNEKELKDALSENSPYKIVELEDNIQLTDTVVIENEGVLLRGYSLEKDTVHNIRGADGKTMFRVDVDHVHMDTINLFPKQSIAIQAAKGEMFKLTHAFIYTEDTNSSGIVIEDYYKPIDDFGNFVDNYYTAIIQDSIIVVPQICVSFAGGILYLEDNLIENCRVGLNSTSIESPRNIKGNIFFNTVVDFYVVWRDQVEDFIQYNHFDYNIPIILEHD